MKREMTCLKRTNGLFMIGKRLIDYFQLKTECLTTEKVYTILT